MVSVILFGVEKFSLLPITLQRQKWTYSTINQIVNEREQDQSVNAVVKVVFEDKMYTISNEFCKKYKYKHHHFQK